MKKLLNNRGFTLVELMVVVAIIGILAAIAIPNFTTYQAKARQSEAKIALSGVYTAEKAYQIESNSFTACLSSIGVGVEGTGANSFYTIGFEATAHTACPSVNGTACADTAGVSHFLAGSPSGATATRASLSATACASSAFVAGAGGIINADHVTARPDVWTITQDKTVKNIVINLK